MPLPTGGNSTVRMPKYRPWKTAKPYVCPLAGALTYMQFFNAPVLILNRTRTALDLLEKRGAKSSSRPYFTYLADM